MKTAYINNVLLFLAPLAIAFAPISIPIILLLLTISFTTQNYKRFSAKKLQNIFNNKLLIILIITLAIWGAIGSHSVEPIKLLIRIASIFLFGLLLIENKISTVQLKIVTYSYLSAIILLVVLFLIPLPETYNEFLVLKVNRSLCFFALLSPILYHYLCQVERSKFAVLLFIITATLMFLSHSATAKLAFIVINFAWLVFRKIEQKKIFNILLITYFIANIFALVLIKNIDKQKLAEKNILQYSFLHRTCIWEFTFDKFLKKPFFGYGFNSAENEAFSERHNKEICIKGNKKTIKSHRDINYFISLHPHYNILQILFEFGALGLLVFCYLLYSFHKKIIAITNNHKRSIALAVFYGYLAIGTTGFDIWQNWFLASIFLLIFFFKSYTNLISKH